MFQFINITYYKISVSTICLVTDKLLELTSCGFNLLNNVCRLVDLVYNHVIRERVVRDDD